ncbi:MAG: hypothetical protein COA78_34890 [Blastopirellula sp.]|nr:MAG: hypothetical protein COA78_34890 [Blastopirellula sp.]
MFHNFLTDGGKEIQGVFAGTRPVIIRMFAQKIDYFVKHIVFVVILYALSTILDHESSARFTQESKSNFSNPLS